MKVSLVPFIPPKVDSLGRPMGEGRSGGLHLSDVIKHRRQLLGEDLAGGNENFMTMGWLFELWVGQALAQFVGFDDADLEAPGEIIVDAIAMNPDRRSKRDGSIWEFKATYRSLRKILGAGGELDPAALMANFWHYLVQIMSYCRAHGTLKAWLVVFFVNGDYSHKPPNGGPQFMVMRLRFTQKELDANWRSVLVDAADLRRIDGKG